MERAISTSPALEAGRILSAIQHDKPIRLEPHLDRVRDARVARTSVSGDEDERWDLLEGILERMRATGDASVVCPDTCVRLLKHLSRPAASPRETPESQRCCSSRPPITNAFLFPALTS